jgi:hypothetical protein
MSGSTAATKSAPATAPTAAPTAAAAERVIEHLGVQIVVPRTITEDSERDPSAVIATHQQEYETQLRQLVLAGAIANGHGIFAVTQEIGRIVVSNDHQLIAISD